MPEHTATKRCPRCANGSTYLLDNVSRISWFDYYRCSTCGHVWTAERAHLQAVYADRRRQPARAVLRERRRRAG